MLTDLSPKLMSSDRTPEPGIGVPSVGFKILHLQVYRLSTVRVRPIDILVRCLIWALCNEKARQLFPIRLTLLIYLSTALVCLESLMAQLPSKTFNLFLAVVIRVVVWYCWHALCGLTQFASTHSVIRSIEFSRCKCS